MQPEKDDGDPNKHARAVLRRLQLADERIAGGVVRRRRRRGKIDDANRDRQPGRAARIEYPVLDGGVGRWTGLGDAPDFPATKAPDFRPEEDARAMDAICDTNPVAPGWRHNSNR